MSWQEFIVGLIDGLAWPASFVVIFLLLRRHIIALMPDLSRLKYRNIEVEFTKSLKELREQAKDIPILAASEEDKLHLDFPELQTMAAISPRAAIAEAWTSLEAAAVEALSRRVKQNIDESTFIQTNIAQSLRDKQLVNHSMARMFLQLQKVRNNAVHSTEVTIDPDELEFYLATAVRLANYLRSR